MDNNITTPSPEELQEEQTLLADVKDDDFRDSIVSSLGLEDNEDNADLINKIVEQRKEDRKKLSQAIGAKIKWRETAKNAKPTSPKEDKSKAFDPEEIGKQAEAKVREALDSEYLEDTEHSDELKEAIKQEAKRLGVSARKAEKSEFIQFKIEKEKAAIRINEAAKNGNKKGRSVGVTDPSVPLNPEDFDLSTEEGRKEWDEAKKVRAKARQT